MPERPKHLPGLHPAYGVGYGCLAIGALGVVTLVLNVATALLFVRLWLAYAYKGVEFYHSSASRGGFHVALNVAALTSLGCIGVGMAFYRRPVSASYRGTVLFLCRAFAVVCLVVSLIEFAWIVFDELPQWEPVRGG